ncbi:MAG: hypothetical protein R2817_06615 [Flavobacteriales bacterium]
MRKPIALMVVLVSLVAKAQPYQPSWGSWSNVTYNAFGEERIGAMAWTPDGKVGLCGSYLDNSPLGDQVFYALLDTAGFLDPAFDGDGFVTHNVCTTTERCTDMVMLADGRMLSVGYEDFTGAPDQLFVHRINTDGTMDSTFAVDGEFLLMLNGTTRGMSIGHQSNERIIVAGWDGNWESFVMRLHPDGTLDTSFGENGYRFLPVSLGDLNETRKLVVLPDDGIAVVGYYFIQSTIAHNSYLWRLDADGNTVTGFGNNGLVLVPCSNGRCDQQELISVWPNGDLQTAGYWSFVWPGGIQGSSFMRFSANGQLVTSWGTNGRVQLPLYVESVTAKLQAVHPLPDGRLLALPQRLEHSLIALLADGSPDLSFGPDGRWQANLGSNTPFMQHDMVVTPDGGKVLIGSGVGVYNSFLVTQLFIPQLSTGMSPSIIADNAGPRLLGRLPGDDALMLEWPAGMAGDANIALYAVDGRWIGTVYQGPIGSTGPVQLQLPENISNGTYLFVVRTTQGTTAFRFIR